MGTNKSKVTTTKKKKDEKFESIREFVEKDMMHDRIKIHVDEMNKVFDKYATKKNVGREKLIEVIHDTLDKQSIDNENMTLDLLPLTLLNQSLNKLNKGKDNGNHASIGYMVYVDGKTHKVHTLLIDGSKEKMDDLFIKGECK